MTDDRDSIAPATRGLDAGELALAARELDAALRGARIADAVQLATRDDLLLYCETAAGRRALHVACGGKRARLTLTRRRFARDELASGPRADQLANLLREATIRGITAIDGQRCARLELDRDGTRLTLHVELFGARGLWALADAEGSLLVLSRLPNEAQRTLRPGERYVEPAPAPPRASADPAPAPRFSTPCLDAIDRVFSALDRQTETGLRRDELQTAIERGRRRLRDRLLGLDAQDRAIAGVAELRLHADLLLAYASTLPGDAGELRVQDPYDDTREGGVPRDRRVPAHAQAARLYDRARRLEAARAVAAAQRAEAEAELLRFAAFEAELANAGDDESRQLELRLELARRGLVPKPPSRAVEEQQKRLAKVTKGERFRRFLAGDGTLILVGRDDAQNDRLTTRIARGNDLWLHVGRGWAGSHVVVRLQKGKGVSQETLLDAATLAIHFSKVRGTTAEDVTWTEARHVRKPKGMPPGKVVAAQPRTLRVRMEEARLRRLLDSASETEGPP
ncbi:MAG: DUF814 domain-containing protein [Planctomycetes bacterium]|nr:DUF814 domain-containing protein [Planctomycetota bacterium]